MTYFFHTCLLVILYTILSIQDKIKPNIKSIGKFIIFTIIIVLFNYFISNSHLLWIFALINVVLYGSFIQFIFHKNITDSLYLSISYWICIEMVDLIFQFCRIDYLNLTSNYLFMFVLIVIMYVPYLYLEKVEKKIWIFILPITLCFFMIYILENEDLFERISMIILIGLFISNLLYLYFFSFTIKNIELQKEKNELQRKLKIAQNNYNNTFDFLHALIHDSHSIDMYFKNKEYEKAENVFCVMKKEIIEKFNIIYTGNTALSTAICNINLGNTTIQHFVKCNTEEFNDADLTIDEPFNGLDLQTKKRVIDELENLNKQGTTILWSSHEINQLREMSDRYIFINCGKIVGHMQNERKYKAVNHEDPLEQYYFEVCKNV